jgi:hypothetical protein
LVVDRSQVLTTPTGLEDHGHIQPYRNQCSGFVLCGRGPIRDPTSKSIRCAWDTMVASSLFGAFSIADFHLLRSEEKASHADFAGVLSALP